MADSVLTVSSGVDFDGNSVRHAARFSSLFAGGAIVVGPCYIDEDGVVQNSVKTVASITGKPDYLGFAVKGTADEDPIVLFGAGTRLVNYSTEMTPGTPLYISDTAGKLTATGLSVALAACRRRQKYYQNDGKQG